MAQNYRFLRFPEFRDKAFTMSYDDGSKNDIRLTEIMKRYGLKGTFNINSALFGKGGEWRLSASEVKELYDDPSFEVAVHGARHTSLTVMDKAQAAKDVLSDRETLENLFGRVIKGMAYASGAFDDDVVQILKDCGISYSRTVISTEDFEIPRDWLKLPATCHHDNPRLFDLLDKFLNEPKSSYYWANRPKLFYLWGHSHEFQNNQNWDRIEKVGQTLEGRTDVWFATNGEIYDYVKAYDALEFSVDGSYIKNPTAKDVWIEYFDKEAVIGAGQTVKMK